jgi:hypothetical protein
VTAGEVRTQWPYIRIKNLICYRCKTRAMSSASARHRARVLKFTHNPLARSLTKQPSRNLVPSSSSTAKNMFLHMHLHADHTRRNCIRTVLHLLFQLELCVGKKTVVPEYFTRRTKPSQFRVKRGGQGCWRTELHDFSSEPIVSLTVTGSLPNLYLA